jgi:hypothetical protein
MQIIIAHLNNSENLSTKEVSSIKMQIPEISRVIIVNRVSDFNEMLEMIKEDSILFSNFPPNSSYPESGKKLNYEEKEYYINRYWEADSYSKSTELFNKVNENGYIKSIHFMTGAPHTMVNIETLWALLPNKKITCQSTGGWIGHGKNFMDLKFLYILNKIKEGLI